MNQVILEHRPVFVNVFSACWRLYYDFF